MNAVGEAHICEPPAYSLQLYTGLIEDERNIRAEESELEHLSEMNQMHLRGRNLKQDSVHPAELLQNAGVSHKRTSTITAEIERSADSLFGSKDLGNKKLKVDTIEIKGDPVAPKTVVVHANGKRDLHTKISKPVQPVGNTVSDRTKSLILQKISTNSPVSKPEEAYLKPNVVTILASGAPNIGNVHEAIMADGSESPYVIIEQFASINQTEHSAAVTPSDCQLPAELSRFVKLINMETLNSEDLKVSPQGTPQGSPSSSPRSITQGNTTSVSTVKTGSPLSQASITSSSYSKELFRCDECDYYSHNKHYLKQHSDLVHSADRPYKCPFCNYAGKRGHALREHLIVHSNERPHECSHCNATFRKKGHLTNHIKLHTHQRLIKCPLCKELIPEFGANGLDSHLKTVHKTEQLYGCDLCNHISGKETAILEHIHEKHSNVKIFKCSSCEFFSSDFDAFQSHMKLHASSVKGKALGGSVQPTGKTGVPSQTNVIKPIWIKCSECGFAGQDAEVIRKHMLEHVKEEEEKKKPSPSQQKEYVQYIKELDHYPREDKLKSYDCDYCDFSSTRACSFVLHMSCHKDVVPNADVLTYLQPVKQSQVANIVKPRQDISPIKAAITSRNSLSQNLDQSPQSKTNIDVGGQENRQPTVILERSDIGIHQVTDKNEPKSAVVEGILQTEVPATKTLPLIVFPENTPKQQIDEILARTIVAEKKKYELPVEFRVHQVNPANLPFPATDGTPRKLAYCITPIPKQEPVLPKYEPVPQTGDTVFTHDSIAGRFRCTICGYQCEYQRTIKAHIWKHSGNKNIDYPMFQNGPLSVYDDTPIIKEATAENTKLQWIKTDVPNTVSVASVEQEAKFEKMAVEKPDEQTSSNVFMSEDYKLSSAAPALAHLLAARAMIGMNTEPCNSQLSVRSGDSCRVNMNDTAVEEESEIPQQHEKIHEASGASSKETEVGNVVLQGISDEDDRKLVINVVPEPNDKNTVIDPKLQKTVNVVVEAVESVAGGTSFTGMKSQQNSPRMVYGNGAQQETEPSDSGVSELHPDSPSRYSATADQQSHSCVLSTATSLESQHVVCEEVVETSQKRRRVRSDEFDTSFNSKQFLEVRRPSTPDGSSSTKRVRTTSASTEESAVTLLSLLKKGPNYNPACPPTRSQIHLVTSEPADISSDQEDNSSCLEESTVSSETSDPTSKPKSGISSSLLAVIEQLRERSQLDVDEDRSQASKKGVRRRSRRSSLEDRESKVEDDNVEQFQSDGDIKNRCKLCHYTNDDMWVLRYHMRLHKTKQPHECSLCDFMADSSEALQDHMIQHCKVRTYQCKMCPSAFNYKSQLRAHMRAHNDQDLQVSEQYDFPQKTIHGYAKQHSDSKSCRCEMCIEQLHNVLPLRSGKKDDHVRENSYLCEDCDFVATGPRELKNHQKIHARDSLKKCSECDFTCTGLGQLSKHLAEHDESVPLKCEMCGFTAVSIRSLKSHMKRHVNDQRFVQQPLEQYKCNLCGYVCHHLPSLKSHMWRHAADEHYSYQFTNEVINAAIDFDTKIESQDTKQEDVVAFNDLLQEKLKNQEKESGYNGEKGEMLRRPCCWVTFRCCQCGFETINKAELNVHMKSHSDVIKMTLEVPNVISSGQRDTEEK